MSSSPQSRVQAFFHRESSTLSFVVADKSTTRCAVIDAARHFDSN
ncbi:MAG: hypothetical protein ABIQ97_01475 [Lysobacteraceae bacterium]